VKNRSIVNCPLCGPNCALAPGHPNHYADLNRECIAEALYLRRFGRFSCDSGVKWGVRQFQFQEMFGAAKCHIIGGVVILRMASCDNQRNCIRSWLWRKCAQYKRWCIKM